MQGAKSQETGCGAQRAVAFLWVVRRLAAIVGVTVASSIIFVGTASAWTNYVSGMATCSSNSASYSITWTIENDANAAEVVTATSATGGLSTVSGSPVDIPASPGTPYKSATMSQVLPASTASPASLTVQGVWTGGTTLSDSGTATLPKPCPVPGELAGHIYNCPSGVATTNEVSGGTLGATGPQTVATQANPLNPTDVLAGTYTMIATPPTGYRLVTCNGASTVNSSGTSATESVAVPAGGSGTGIFYVSLIPVTTAAGATTTTTTTRVSGPVLGPVTSSTTPVTKSRSSTLAFTGVAGFFTLLGLGLASLLAGSAILISRRRWMKTGLTNPSVSAS